MTLISSLDTLVSCLPSLEPFGAPRKVAVYIVGWGVKSLL